MTTTNKDVTANCERYIAQIKTEYLETDLPEFLWDGIERYLAHGIEPGNFLSSILKDELTRLIVFNQTPEQLQLIGNMVKFFYKHIPGAACGSRKRYADWIKTRGILGDAI